jgi:hypothetical protein
MSIMVKKVQQEGNIISTNRILPHFHQDLLFIIIMVDRSPPYLVERKRKMTLGDMFQVQK